MNLREAAEMARKAIYDGESFDYLSNQVFAALEEALSQPDPEPIAWYHPMSGRVRWDGKNLPPSWLPLYAEPKHPEVKDINMSTGEKVARFLQDRKNPVDAKTIADYYLMSKSAIRRALQELEHEGKASYERKGSTLYWTWNRKPVAVPLQALKLSNTPAFNRPIQNSYPAVRGYDD